MTQTKQSAMKAMDYPTFVQEYERTRDDKSIPYNDRHETLKALERKFPKYCSKYMLLSGWAALQENDLLLCVVTPSRTGQSRLISVYKVVHDTQGDRLANLTYHVAKVLGYNMLPSHHRNEFRTDTHATELMHYLSEILFGVQKASALRIEVL